MRVSSSGAGFGGSLAVRAYVPSGGITRYSGHCGLVVVFPGGGGGGDLSFGGVEDALTREGLIAVKFLFPGSSWSDGLHTYSSQGTYDYRGTNSLRAARDVVRFCLGLQTDRSGNSITALMPALTSNVGLFGSSNGGSTALSMLAMFAADLPGVGYFASFESPSCDQMATGLLGTKGTDPNAGDDGNGNGLPEDDGTNPYFVAYDPIECSFDLTKLRFDASQTTDLGTGAGYAGLAYFDGNGNGMVDRTSLGTDSHGSILYSYDLVSVNGVIDAGEDYPISGYVGKFGSTLKLVYPTRIRQALEAYSPPATTATTVESMAYWRIRSMVTAIPTVAAAFPNLMTISAVCRQDHIQAAHLSNGHLHVQQLMDGLSGYSLWRRVDPDYSYLEEVHSLMGAAMPAGCPDNDANRSLAVGDIHGIAEPASIVMYWVDAAAIMELADRVYMGNTSVNLSGLLVSRP